MAENSGLHQRGLLLLGLMLVIVAGIWYFGFFLPGSGQPGPAAQAATSKAQPSPKGWEIRYNAALALARRGSTHLPFDVVREMLDENRQMANFRVQLHDGRE